MSWTRLENHTYWLVFLGSFFVVAIWESWRPRRTLSSSATRRWSRHGIILLGGTMLPAVLYRISPVMMALVMVNSRWGLLNRSWLPFWVRFVFSVLVLDLVRYFVHWCNHKLPWLWRVHHVHHSDPDLDLSTGARAHPIETILMEGANLAGVAILAAPPAAVLVIEIFSSAQSFFSHANASLPTWLDKGVRWLFVTPDMHRVHHSEEVSEQSKNFGDIFPWWDWIFRTYLDAPAAGQDRVRVGLTGFQNEESLDLLFMLLHPFRSQPQETGFQQITVARPSETAPN